MVGRPSPGARGAGFLPGAFNSFSVFLFHPHFLKIFRFLAPRPHPLNSIQAQAAFACGPGAHAEFILFESSAKPWWPLKLCGK